MRTSRLDRRRFLRGSLNGGVAVKLGLPLLEAMCNGHGEAHADGTALPARFGVWFWGMGIRREQWVPATTGKNYGLTPLLTPLAAHKGAFCVVTGSDPGGGVSHAHGPVAVLTGSNETKVGENCHPNGASIDQIVADTLGKGTAFRSLETEVFPPFDVGRSNGLYDYTSWRNGSSPNPTEWDPRRLWKRLSELPGAKPSSPGMASNVQGSYLDAVQQDARELMLKVSASDKARLEQHMEHVRSIELRLGVGQPAKVMGGVALPADPSAVVTDQTIKQPFLNSKMLTKLMAELIAYALVTDATRVFTLVYSRPNYHLPIREIPGVTDLHEATHNEPKGMPSVVKGVGFIMERLADTLSVFAQTPDGPGRTLLDNLAMIATSDLTHGYDHTNGDYPIIVAGGARGKLRSGQHIRLTGDTKVTRVGATLLSALGQPPGFGSGGFATSNTIPDLLA
jgi:hypothetical protein